MALLDNNTRDDLEVLFAQLVCPVRLVLFTETQASLPAGSSATCWRSSPVSRSSSRSRYTTIARDWEAVRAFGLSRAPATAVVGEHDFGVRFIGVTGGYEFASLVDAITMASLGRSGLEPGLEQLAGLIREPLQLHGAARPPVGGDERADPRRHGRPGRVPRPGAALPGLRRTAQRDQRAAGRTLRWGRLRAGVGRCRVLVGGGACCAGTEGGRRVRSPPGLRGRRGRVPSAGRRPGRGSRPPGRRSGWFRRRRRPRAPSPVRASAGLR